MGLYSLKLEMYVLGGLLKYPDSISEFDSVLNVADFYHSVHKSIYSVLRNSYVEGNKVDKILVSEKLKNVGVHTKDGVDIHGYLETVYLKAPNKRGIKPHVQQLVKYRILRELEETADDLKYFLNSESADKSVDEIITKSDSIYSEKILSYEIEESPQNILDDFLDVVEEAGMNPSDESGLLTPYDEFNRLFGGLRDGNIYAIVSRPAQGKTTLS